MDPRIELRWPAHSLDENLLVTIVGSSLPDRLLDKETILCYFLHFVWIPGIFELPTTFVDQLKYPSWGGLVTLDQEVFLAPVGDVAIFESTIDLTDP